MSESTDTELNWHRLDAQEWAATFPNAPHFGDYGDEEMYPGTYIHAVEDDVGGWYLETITDEGGECLIVDHGSFTNFEKAQLHARTLGRLTC